MVFFRESGLAAFDGFQNPCFAFHLMEAVVGVCLRFELVIGKNV